MTCEDAEILLHALIDGELDASHVREVEAHLAGCAKCAVLARDYREMKKAFAGGGLRYTAPVMLLGRHPSEEAVGPAGGHGWRPLPPLRAPP